MSMTLTSRSTLSSTRDLGFTYMLFKLSCNVLRKCMQIREKKYRPQKLKFKQLFLLHIKEYDLI